MHDTPAFFRQLTDKYLTDTITASEKELLFSMISEGAYQSELEQLLAEVWERPVTGGEDIAVREQIFDNIRTQQKKVRQLRIRRWSAAAAIALVLGAAGTVFFLQREHRSPQPLAAVQPGSQKAVLILGDQSQVPLDSSFSRTLQQGGATVSQKGGQLIYTANSQPSGAVTFNTLQTARGGQFRLQLPDGTRVWVNAGSTVRYPAVFPANERHITVTGEAYMEVQADKRPFLVSTQHETVQVLGTAFNINAYEEEPSTLTTLLSGKIRIVNNHQTAVVLAPGQQAAVSHQASTEIPVAEADPDQAIAWKNGYFDFENERLDVIFRLLSRWYDVQFVAEGKAAGLQFSAVVTRTSSLEEVLSVLSATGAVNFSREGNTIRARVITP
ncbi:FecR domain-containing protein [Chitinophaga oryzae]|uniref:FecR domain-containing protein n=1 Tax=Chitinophaga oryzae TaxID=2725414 RepID=A0ABX6LEF7_9BACT|nr:FecR domain-containing protein [Chitinophaga oryzae]QJB38372.1 FecR domain-containing protein [Chitinophaga oryzae]